MGECHVSEHRETRGAGRNAGAETLRSAANLISVHGHCKNKLNDSAGRFCLVGAIIKQPHGGDKNWHWHSLVSAVNDVVQEQFADRAAGGCFSGVDFNNHPDTTGAEVIAVLEKAALKLEERA